MSVDNKIAVMRKRVEERRLELTAADAARPQDHAASVASASDDLPVFDSRFVLDCLYANALGDGLLYTAIHRDKFVYCKTTGEWLVWSGHCWRKDEYNQAAARVEAVCAVYAEEIRRQGERLAACAAEDTEDSKSRTAGIEGTIKQLRQRIYRLRDSAGRKNCLEMAHTNDTPLAVLLTNLDRDPWKLACTNGVVDLKTGNLHPGTPTDYISKSCGVDYDPDADATIWRQFLDEIYEGNHELISFVIRLLGYAITGEVSEHVFPVFQGRGRNGKGTLIEAVAAVLGDYAGAVPAEMLLDNNKSGGAGSATPEIMMLKGLRFAYASETDENRRFSASKVKWLTGGDSMVGRNNYDKSMTTFSPTHLLVLLTNPTPDAPPTDFAFWSRCLLIRHRISFVKHEPENNHQRRVDLSLGKRLTEHLPGLLRLMVEGCLDWQHRGLSPPATVTGETDKYQEQMNVVGRFVGTCCKTGSAGLQTSAADLYGAFRCWFTETEGNKVPSQKWFGNQFRRLELFDDLKREGKIWYCGIELTPEYERKIEEMECSPQKKTWGVRDQQGG